MSESPLAQYSFRRSVLEKERSYALFHDRIVFEGPDLPPQSVALADVRKLHLKYEHTKQRGYYQCFIHTRRGRIDLRHLHWAGIGDFEDRRAAYTPFVRALLARLASMPGVVFQAGSMANFVGAIAGAPVMLALAVVAFRFGHAGKAVFALFMMLLCLIMIGPSRPRRLDPLAPPAALLPD